MNEPPDIAGRRWAVVSQISMFGAQIIAPALIWLFVGRRNAFVRSWASEALNLQLLWVGLFVVLVLVLPKSSLPAFYGVATYFLLMAAYALPCGVIGARKAYRGELWCYPFNVRLVPGRLARRERPLA
jgi:uncharacterized Tic20 family protein